MFGDRRHLLVHLAGCDRAIPSHRGRHWEPAWSWMAEVQPVRIGLLARGTFGGIVALLHSHHAMDKAPLYDPSYANQGAGDHNMCAPCNAAFGLARPWCSPH
jgi:hypothetical protein